MVIRLIVSLKNRIKKKFNFISNFFNGIKMVKNNDFPGIVFVSFESLNFLKKLINQHNKILQDSDKDNDLKKIFKYQICFD